jgi:hypothetical protein
MMEPKANWTGLRSKASLTPLHVREPHSVIYSTENQQDVEFSAQLLDCYFSAVEMLNTCFFNRNYWLHEGPIGYFEQCFMCTEL